jgi:hypothetical protein
MHAQGWCLMTVGRPVAIADRAISTQRIMDRQFDVQDTLRAPEILRFRYGRTGGGPLRTGAPRAKPKASDALRML